jgi:hypothetical protein
LRCGAQKAFRASRLRKEISNSMKTENNLIDLELKSQVLNLQQAKRLLQALASHIGQLETQKASDRKRKATRLFEEEGEIDRIALFEETRLMFPRVFNKYRQFGYHPREIYLVILDVLNTESSLHRELHKYTETE